MSHLSNDSLVERLASDRGLPDEVAIKSESVLIDSDLDKAFKAKELEEKDESIKGHKQDREQRKVFSFRIFWFMCAYMVLSLVIVFCCGFGCMQLSESVLIALLTTTLANVIGVFNFVAKYLFHKT
ncbi:MAG: hypothetical protein NC102_09245 [Clostridium sp.]|nr:hypothetical protein [Clostridium sp.]